jgi:uncharacterized protein YecE (DUF72 family)
VSGTIHVGTSGWSYDDWDSLFYPEHLPRRRWFEHYRRCFSTVEINNTFYRLPGTSAVERWHDQAPDRFRYAVKGSRYLTHRKKLNDPEDPVATITGRMEALKSFLGIWLWQLPPNLHRDDARLERFLRALPGGAPHAVEFRHRSWVDDEVHEILRRYEVALVWLSSAEMPEDTTRTADHVYVRFHGLEEGYRYEYSSAELEPWAQRLRDVAADGGTGWVYFNNDHRAKAPSNAGLLREMLGDAAVHWP